MKAGDHVSWILTPCKDGNTQLVAAVVVRVSDDGERVLVKIGHRRLGTTRRWIRRADALQFAES